MIFFKILGLFGITILFILGIYTLIILLIYMFKDIKNLIKK